MRLARTDARHDLDDLRQFALTLALEALAFEDQIAESLQLAPSLNARLDLFHALELLLERQALPGIGIGIGIRAEIRAEIRAGLHRASPGPRA
tara:strand:- start:2458 stop:2736 length:279 start_codon:yes stop_codon:yes gene_type:complete